MTLLHELRTVLDDDMLSIQTDEWPTKYQKNVHVQADEYVHKHNTHSSDVY